MLCGTLIVSCGLVRIVYGLPTELLIEAQFKEAPTKGCMSASSSWFGKSSANIAMCSISTS